MRLLRAADRTPVPWKNGGGVTTEVAAYPHGAGFDDFDWRVSLANVDSDGPFSIFPGIDRTLVLLEGAVRLDIADRAPVELTPASPPLTFPGDVASSATLLTGPALDLNVMVRRGRLEAQVVELSTQAELPAPDGLSLLIVTQGQVTFAHPDGAMALGQLDALQLESVTHGRIETGPGARAYLAAFRPAR